MTDHEWFACTNPEEMLQCLSGIRSNRKLRLLGCAYCRRVWHLLEEDSQHAIEISELYADKQASGKRLAAALQKAAEIAEEKGWEGNMFMKEKKYAAAN